MEILLQACTILMAGMFLLRSVMMELALLKDIYPAYLNVSTVLKKEEVLI